MMHGECVDHISTTSITPELPFVKPPISCYLNGILQFIKPNLAPL